MTQESKRGGKRENAGRKTLNGLVNGPRTITIDDETVAILRQFGDGNLSQGIRKAAMMVKNQDDPHQDLI
jgi:hypothetical protein